MRVHWVVVYRLEGRPGWVVGTVTVGVEAGGGVVVAHLRGSHVIRTFQGPHVRLPEFSFPLNWLVSSYHVQVLFQHHFEFRVIDDVSFFFTRC